MPRIQPAEPSTSFLYLYLKETARSKPSASSQQEQRHHQTHHKLSTPKGTCKLALLTPSLAGGLTGDVKMDVYGAKGTLPLAPGLRVSLV